MFPKSSYAFASLHLLLLYLGTGFSKPLDLLLTFLDSLEQGAL